MPQNPGANRLQVVIATWPFGLPASEVAWKALEGGASPLDAVVAGVSYCEDDSSVDSVGYGGLPDASGEVTLDACVMDADGRCGGVACLRRVRHAAQVARAVMDRTPHVLLVGEAATAFAVSQGFQESNLLSPEAAEKYAAWKKANPQAARPRVPGGADRSHDTIGMLALDRRGRIAGACTTSGRAYKLPGRVGDSPIIGAGLYVDGEVGAAAATGVGEEVIKVAGSFAVVEHMRNGAPPQEAIDRVLRRIEKRRGDRDTDVSFVALRKDGEAAGGSLRAQTNFKFALLDSGGRRMMDSPVLK
jgi:isoaspartyl peptidase/L-asparaginase-like protein (Ntn-hydrolase superfamily)